MVAPGPAPAKRTVANQPPPPLGDSISLMAGDLAYYIPVRSIVLVAETPDHEWVMETIGGEVITITRELAVMLLGFTTIDNGPTP